MSIPNEVDPVVNGRHVIHLVITMTADGQQAAHKYAWLAGVEWSSAIAQTLPKEYKTEIRRLAAVREGTESFNRVLRLAGEQFGDSLAVDTRMPEADVLSLLRHLEGVFVAVAGYINDLLPKNTGGTLDISTVEIEQQFRLVNEAAKDIHYNCSTEHAKGFTWAHLRPLLETLAAALVTGISTYMDGRLTKSHMRANIFNANRPAQQAANPRKEPSKQDGSARGGSLHMPLEQRKAAWKNGAPEEGVDAFIFNHVCRKHFEEVTPCPRGKSCGFLHDCGFTGFSKTEVKNCLIRHKAKNKGNQA